MNQEQIIDVRTAVDGMTVADAVALTSAVVAWLTMRASPDAAEEIAVLAQQIERSWSRSEDN